MNIRVLPVPGAQPLALDPGRFQRAQARRAHGEHGPPLGLGRHHLAGGLLGDRVLLLVHRVALDRL